MGITTAIAIVPPDESFPDDPDDCPANPKAEGDAEVLVLDSAVVDCCAGVGSGRVDVMVTTVGALGEPASVGVTVVREVTTRVDAGGVEVEVGVMVVVDEVVITDIVVIDEVEVDLLVEIEEEEPEVMVDVWVTTDSEFEVTVLVSVVSMTLVVSGRGQRERSPGQSCAEIFST